MKRDKAYYIALGERAWKEGITDPAPNGWQGVAWKKGFDAAYARERPSLDLDHQADVWHRRNQIRRVK